MGSETIYYCECGFKCVEGQLAKTKGACPSCKKKRSDMTAKYGGAMV